MSFDLLEFRGQVDLFLWFFGWSAVTEYARWSARRSTTQAAQPSSTRPMRPLGIGASHFVLECVKSRPCVCRSVFRTMVDAQPEPALRKYKEP